MTEGWLNDDYVILFPKEKIESISSKYGIDLALPGYAAVGLRSWDDFIVRDAQGSWYSVPTVPLDAQYMRPLTVSIGMPLQPDGRLEGRIKWYVKPLIFGGDVNDSQNVTWVSQEQHAELVTWWNAQYQAVKGRTNV